MSWVKTPHYSQGEKFQYKLDETISDFDKNTVFCFKHTDNAYDVDKLCSSSNKKFAKGFLKKIQGISKISIADVHSSDKYTWGFELLKKELLKKSLPGSITKDIQQVHVFRFADNGRIVGFYSSNIFHVIFIDVELCLWDHGS